MKELPIGATHLGKHNAPTARTGATHLGKCNAPAARTGATHLGKCNAPTARTGATHLGKCNAPAAKTGATHLGKCNAPAARTGATHLGKDNAPAARTGATHLGQGNAPAAKTGATHLRECNAPAARTGATHLGKCNAPTARIGATHLGKCNAPTAITGATHLGKCDAPLFGKVAIVGLGLMGGSLAGALRPHCREIIGIDQNTETLAIARQRGFVDTTTLDLTAGVREADIVILSTPVRTILRLLRAIGPLLPAGCLLMDIGSTKMEIMAQMETLPDHINPLGGHPMCGKEVSGIKSAEATLYQDKTFVLTPLERTPDTAIQLGEEIVAAIGARPLRLAPQRHDRLVATISHLPYLVASSLVKTTAQVAEDDPMVWEVAASGFRDTSRVAASEVTMMLDILMTNREAVLNITEAYMEQLGELKHMLDDGNEEQLRMHLETIQRHRKELQFG